MRLSQQKSSAFLVCGTASVMTDSQWSKQKGCFARVTQVWLLSITTPVSLLANELDVRSVLHGQASLGAVYGNVFL